MQFAHIINAALSQESDRPLMQKEVYPVGDALQQYLQYYQRDVALPIHYKELFHYRYTNAIKDAQGKHTHWEEVIYTPELFASLQQKLLATYALLQPGSTNAFKLVAIHYCEFANSMPFRIVLQHVESGASTCFYIKASDASRIYGLELEQLLSPNSINFLYHDHTLVEEHIEGLPGDLFIAEASQLSAPAQKLVAEEFIRFNERCFARLLGDMRSYNFVVLSHDAAPAWRIRAIDFDQQCYEGRLQLYLPQFYKENIRYVEMALAMLGTDTIEAIRADERRLLTSYIQLRQQQLADLLQPMEQEQLSEQYKVLGLRKQLNEYFGTTKFDACTTMGQLVRCQLNHMVAIV